MIDVRTNADKAQTHKTTHVESSVKHSASVMIWAGFSASGSENIYLTMFQERFQPIMTFQLASIFMHDDASCQG